MGFKGLWAEGNTILKRYVAERSHFRPDLHTGRKHKHASNHGFETFYVHIKVIDRRKYIKKVFLWYNRQYNMHAPFFYNDTCNRYVIYVNKYAWFYYHVWIHNVCVCLPIGNPYHFYIYINCSKYILILNLIQNI